MTLNTNLNDKAATDIGREIAFHLARFGEAAAYVAGSTHFIDGGMLRQSGSL